MTLAKVTLTGELPGGGGASYVLQMSEWLTDSTDVLLIPPRPVSGRLTSNSDGSGSLTVAAVIANDNPAPLPAGSTWSLAFSDIPGVPPLDLSFRIYAAPFAFSATEASPAVFTAAGSAYPAGQAAVLAGVSLPGGFEAATTYYVTGVSGDLFSLAATPGGEALESSSAGTGTVAGPATQDISTLVQLEPSAGMAAFLPGSYPGGTGQFLRADGQWASPPGLGDLDGGSAAGGEFPVADIDGGNA